MLKKGLTDGKDIEFDIFTNWENNLLNILVLFVGLGTLIITFIYGVINKMKFDKRFGKILMTIYISFVTVATIIAFKDAYF